MNENDRDELRAVQALRLETLHRDVSEIKSALNELTRAITKLALIEERQTQAAQSLDRAFAALERLEARIQRPSLRIGPADIGQRCALVENASLLILVELSL